MPEPDARQVGTQQLVVFALGAEDYALPITHVQQIIRYTKPRPVASNAPSLRGVISLRGRVLPVYDLAGRLGIESTLTDDTKIVIVETDEETAGVIVDDVHEVLTLSADQLEDVPGGDTTLIGAIGRIDDRLIILLNAAAIHFGELATAYAMPRPIVQARLAHGVHPLEEIAEAILGEAQS